MYDSEEHICRIIKYIYTYDIVYHEKFSVILKMIVGMLETTTITVNNKRNKHK